MCLTMKDLNTIQKNKKTKTKFIYFIKFGIKRASLFKNLLRIKKNKKDLFFWRETIIMEGLKN